MTDLVPQVRRLRESNLHTWGLFFTSAAGVAIWIAAAVYFKLQDYKGVTGRFGPGRARISIL